jgi:hypothetical protein
VAGRLALRVAAVAPQSLFFSEFATSNSPEHSSQTEFVTLTLFAAVESTRIEFQLPGT